MEVINELDYNDGVAAPEFFIKTLASQVNQLDVHAMVTAQKEMLTRFEKTNEMLINYNNLSSMRLETVAKDFKKHTNILVEMKKDLDVIFKKTRLLKSKLNTQYPEAFTASSRDQSFREEEEEEDVFEKDSESKNVSNKKSGSKENVSDN